MTNESMDGWAYNNIEGDPHYDQRIGEKGFGPTAWAGWAYDYGKGRVMLHGSRPYIRGTGPSRICQAATERGQVVPETDIKV